ncbi:MAG: endonuclease/exonuclease/phosphatase family protein [Candidatus Neomarinimicrobiota bacterium]
MPRISSFATAAGVALLGIGGWGCDPIVTIFDDVEQPQYYQAAKIDPPASKDTLTVMTWNIKYGGGAIDFWWACYDDRVLMTEDEVLGNLEVLAEKIRAVDPDILLLQEVDVDSKRSAYVDQMQYLLDNTALNYGVYASMWRTQFAPSDGLGRTDIGPAILARWPLGEAERIALALRTDQDAVTKYFYLRRCIVKANLQLPGRDDFYLVNVHTSAWQAETKVKHIDRFKAELDLIDAGGGLFVAGGDFNTLPPAPLK